MVRNFRSPPHSMIHSDIYNIFSQLLSGINKNLIRKLNFPLENLATARIFNSPLPTDSKTAKHNQSLSELSPQSRHPSCHSDGRQTLKEFSPLVT